MQVRRIEEMKEGWFVGNFDPHAFKSDQFEVCHKLHPKGEEWDVHFHKVATEINFLIHGHMKLQGRDLYSGDIFTLFPGEVADPKFLEDCELIVVKTPSATNDKYNIKDLRTAICLSGQPREVIETWKTFVDYCLPIWPNPDLFVYTSDEFSFKTNAKKFVVEPQIHLWQAEDILIPNYYWKDHLNSCLQMFYGMKKVWELKEEYEQEQGFKYDLVVRTRPDYLYLKQTPLYSFNLNRMTRTGVEFAVGPNDLMKSLFNVYDFILTDGARYLTADTPKRYDQEKITPDIIAAVYLCDILGIDTISMHNPYDYYRIMYRQKLGWYNNSDSSIGTT